MIFLENYSRKQMHEKWLSLKLNEDLCILTMVWTRLLCAIFIFCGINLALIISSVEMQKLNINIHDKFHTHNLFSRGLYYSLQKIIDK